jgi:hypothetical protein
MARFYLPFALIPSLAIIIIARIAGIVPDGLVFEKLMVLVLLGFFLTIACRLFAESRAWDKTRYLVLSAGAMALLAVLLFLAPSLDVSMETPTLPILGASIALLITAAPFLLRDHSNEAVWEYNRATWSGMAAGLAVTILMGGGLLMAITTVDMLRGISFPIPLFGIPFVVSIFIVLAWQLLAGLPGKFDATPADPAPTWLIRLTKFVIVPVIAAFFATIALYLIAFFLPAELPREDFGRAIAGFAIFCVTAHFVTWPIRETGGRALRFFHRHYGYALFAPAVVLALDTGLRVADSGLTEGRYFLLLLAFWLCANAVYNVLPNGRRLVAAPVSLAALLVVASVGPWGATGLSTRLQLSQLESQLISNELLVEGKVVPADALIETEKMRNISATLNLFDGRVKQKALEAWFADRGFELEVWFFAEYGGRTSDIMRSMGLQYISKWDDNPSFDFIGSPEDSLDVEGFSNMGRFSEYASEKKELVAVSRTKVETELNRVDGTLIVRSGADERVVFDLAALAQRLRRKNKTWLNNSLENDLWPDDSVEPPITLDGTSKSGRLTVRLHIHEISGRLVDGAPTVSNIEATVLWRETQTPR